MRAAITATLILVSFLTKPLVGQQPPEKDKRIKEISSEIAALEKKLAELKSELAKLQAPPASIDGAETEKFRAAIHKGVNDLRAEKKLTPLARNVKLDAAAQKHAENMASQEKLAHELDGKMVKDRTEAEGYEASTVGENCGHVPLYEGTNKKADGLTAVVVQVKGWKGSPGHYKLLMTDYLVETGIGIAQTKSGKWYLCQVFAVPIK